MSDSDRHHTYPQPGTWGLAFANLLFLAACLMIILSFWYIIIVFGGVLLSAFLDTLFYFVYLLIGLVKLIKSALMGG